MSWRVFVLCSACVLLTVSKSVTCFEDEDQPGEFVPTSEWQEVKPGQTIPPGLHVRLDLEKGGKWAKLMDDEVSETKSVVPVDTADTVAKTESAKKLGNFKVEELKAALKKMKDERQSEMSEEEKKAVKDKYRSMDEIKSAFESLNLNQESDFDAMTKLMKRFKDPATPVEEKVLALQDLENYVHQVDNAVDFIKLDGIDAMVKALNRTEDDVKLEAAHVIGSAVQSNPAVQVKAVEAGALRSLIHIVGDEKQAPAVRKKALYAVSCLIRHFPAAQFFFKAAGGFSALASCFNEHGTDKLRLKALSLMNDLAVERKEHFSSEADENAKERIRQYNLFSLSTVIEEMGLCKDILKMLTTDQHDERDVLLSVMKNLHGVCKQSADYIQKVKDALRMYESGYKELMVEEEKQGDTDSFFHHMYKTVNDLIDLVEGDGMGIKHIEL